VSILCDVCVIGGGPAGLAAATAAYQHGAKVALIEREARLGGILKQCVHDGFGVLRFGEKLSGPEYAERDLALLKECKGIELLLQTFVDKIKPHALGWQITVANTDGMRHVIAKSVVLATGCRERTARQIALHGTRPAGVFTAGSAQYYTNILGQLPGKRCVIQGSGDIGLIMARRLKLEGAQVLGVYTRGKPAGLMRNIAQCLNDFDIPLYMGKTVTRAFGHERMEAVEVISLDEKKRPIPGTEERVECDTLILSVGLIPENELAETLGVELHPATRGPICDQNGMTTVPGVFSCGNAAHVNDLVDYVTESGVTAGQAAASYAAKFIPKASEAYTEPAERAYINISPGSEFLYAFPQRIDTANKDNITIYFRSKDELDRTQLRVTQDGKELLKKRYRKLRPPEMERVVITPTGVGDIILGLEGIA